MEPTRHWCSETARANIARRLAVSGFTALAVDMLHPQGGTPADEDRAREMFTRVDRAAAVRDLVAVVEWMRTRPDANGKVGVGGFCWGGAQTFRFATNDRRIKAAFVFYGTGPEMPADLARIECPVYGFYGGNDARVVLAHRPER